MSDAELEQLRTAWAALPPGGRLSGCAPPEEIWEAVLGQRDEAQVRALLEHSVRCSDCAALWRLAHELGGAALALEASPAAPATLRRLPRRWAVAGGALAAAALLAGVLWPRASVAPEGPVLRGGDAEALRSVLDNLPLKRAHPVLRWTGAPEGSRYTATVSTRDLTVLFRASGLAAPEVELPPAALSSLAPGAEVVWRVEATLPDGRRLSSGAILTRVE
jgi:hypothetical protein